MKTSKVTKAKFMRRLRGMVDHVTSSDKSIRSFCPGAIHVCVPYSEEYNEIDSSHCETCRKVMDIHVDKCPCQFYSSKKALRIAKKKIKQYFENSTNKKRIEHKTSKGINKIKGDLIWIQLLQKKQKTETL